MTLTFRDARTCKAVAAALEVDNPKGGMVQKVQGATLVLTAKAASAKSLRETLDDWVRCAAAAEAAAAAGGKRS